MSGKFWSSRTNVKTVGSIPYIVELPNGNIILWPGAGATVGVNIDAFGTNTGLCVLDLIYFDPTNSNTKLGYQAGKNVVAGSTFNTLIGHQAGFNTTAGGGANTAIGWRSLYSNTSGDGEVAVGFYALQANTSGRFNVGIGGRALWRNTSGDYNVGIGGDSFYENTTGGYNAGVGYGALRGLISGSYNAALGNLAGGFIADGITWNLTPASALYLGSGTRAKVDGGINEIVIGADAIGEGSNSVVLGNVSITKTILRAFTGIGVVNPLAVLHLKAGTIAPNTAPLKFTVAGTALLTTPEVGVLEPFNDDLYYTINTGAARKPLVMTDGFPLTSGRIPYATTNGRLTDSANFTNDGVSVIVTGIAATDLPSYGAEILDTAGWTVTAGWTEAPDDVFTHAAGVTTLSHNAIPDAAQRYQISWTVSGWVSGSFDIDVGGINIPSISATGSFGPTTINANTLVITPTNDFVGTISLLSMKKILAKSTPVVYLKNSTPAVRVEMRATKERYNTFVGEGSGGFDTTGKYNQGFGMECLNNMTSGEANVGVGTFAVYANTTGQHNIGIGFAPLFANVTGKYNVAMGGNALYNNVIGDNNVAIGFEAGYWETGSDKLFIDSRRRIDEADARIKSLIYGVFASLTANQYLNINGNLIVRETIKIMGGAPGAGKVLTSDADGDATWQTPSGGTVTAVTGTLPVASSGGAAPDISLVNDVGATITQVDTGVLASLDTVIPTSLAVVTAIGVHAALITGVHGLIFTAGKTLTLTESLTLNALPIGGLAVATAANTLGSLAVGLTTQILVGGGAATVPAWGTDLPTAVTIGGKYIYRADGTDIPVTDGGTGVSTFALNGILYGNAANTIGVTAIGTEGQVLRVGASPFVPAWDSLLGLGLLTDPGADRIFFWDDSESLSKFLTVSTGLDITAATLTCTITQYTDALARTACIAATIVDNDLTHSPDGNSVFDALAGKAPLASPTFTGTVTMPSSVVIPDGGAIGQAAGPLITFDDTLNYLEITGCNVGIGTTAPSGPLSVTPLQYNTGTASQSLTTVTGVGTTWTSGMVGSQLVYANGVSAGTITAFGSATSLTVSTSQTVASQAYTISYTGLQVSSTGNVGIGTTGPGYKLDVKGNIVNSNPSQGYLGLTGDLPGYPNDTYPTLKTNYSYMYFSIAGAFSAYINSAGTFFAHSSRDIKENFVEVDPQEILAKIDQLPMTQWNFKDEDPFIKHIAPIAEDFHALFGLNGDNNKMISHIDPSGVALVGIKALSNKLSALEKSLIVDKTTGNIGIGTTTPASLLHLFNNNTANSFLTVEQVNGTYWTGLNLKEGSYNWFMEMGDADLRFTTAHGGAPAFYIKNNGNVGIGTTVPSSKLSINGGLHVGGDSDAGDNNLLVDGTIKIGTKEVKAERHLRFTIIDPASVYAVDTQVCVVPKLDAAITITNIEVTCDADPATEVTGDLKYADAFIGLGTPTLIHAFDTTAGVFSSGAETLAVPTAKCIYIQFDISPDAGLVQISFDVTYNYG